MTGNVAASHRVSTAKVRSGYKRLGYSMLASAELTDPALAKPDIWWVVLGGGLKYNLLICNNYI